MNATGVLRLLEAIRLLDMGECVRFYQASTSELFGNVQETPQSETTPFRPRSPYAISKHFAFQTVVNYREAYGFHASNGILFNHEGPNRGENFVSRKITRAVAAIQHGLQDRLYLGNINSRRDWGHARDYVEGMWLMLQKETPGDYVLATGEEHSVRDFVELAFDMVGRPIEWDGSGLEEKGIDRKSGKVLIEIDPNYYRPAEVNSLVGNAAKARDELGWTHRRLGGNTAALTGVEHGANFGSEFCMTVGLAQKLDTAIEPSLMHDCILRVAGCKEHLEVWTELRRRFGQLASVHAARHHHIGEKQVDFDLRLQNVERLMSTRRAGNAIAKTRELLNDILTH